VKEFLMELGFQKYDLALLILCPLGAVVGSYAHAILQLINPHRMPRPGTTRFLSNKDALGRVAWWVFRLTLGAILGLVVALYFIGALQENLTTLAKIVALSILLGFAAPKLWLVQERVVVERATNLLSDLLSQQSSPRRENAGSNPSIGRTASGKREAAADVEN
jgi:hypothetical protein